MEDLKSFELNNKVLEDFDTLMSYHLDKVEELKIKETTMNPKLYNIISLCLNVKTLIIEGDLRVDTNKIVYNLCKPDMLENLVLDSVKLPTNKVIQKFTSLRTISLNNIKFSDIPTFFNQIGNKDSVIALKLEKVDLLRNSISICNTFRNLQFLNINELINCKYDDFSFLTENKNLERINLQNMRIDLSQVNILNKLTCEKTIDVELETSDICEVQNSFEVDCEGNSYLTINATDLKKAKKDINFFKINNLYIVLNEDFELIDYVKTFKKVKDSVSIAITDIVYLDVNTIKRLRDKLDVEYVNIIENSSEFKIKYTYTVDKYIDLRDEFEKIKEQVLDEDTETDKFSKVYEYFKKNYKLVKPSNLDSLEEAILEKRCIYNLYAVLLNSSLAFLNINSKIIEGNVYDSQETVLWNQVELDGKWYNFDLALYLLNRENKKIKIDVSKTFLFDDEEFYKIHTPKKGNPNLCYTIFEPESIEKNKISIKDKLFKLMRRKDEASDTK